MKIESATNGDTGRFPLATAAWLAAAVRDGGEVSKSFPAIDLETCAHFNCYQMLDEDDALIWECADCGETWETWI